MRNDYPTFTFNISYSDQYFEKKATNEDYPRLFFNKDKINCSDLEYLIRQGHFFTQSFTSHDRFTVKDRNGDSFNGAQVIFLDIDHGPIPANEFYEKLSDAYKPTIFHTTCSYNESTKNYRYRLIYVLDEEIKTLEDYAQMARRIENSIKSQDEFKEIQFDGVSTNAVQLMAGNGSSNIILISTGNIFNQEDFLQDASFVEKPSKSSTNTANNRSSSQQKRGLDEKFANSAFGKDFFSIGGGKMNDRSFLSKYKSAYPLYEATPVDCNIPFICDKNYYKIERRNHGIINQHGERYYKQIRTKIGRRHRVLFNNAMIRLKIQPEMTFEHLLYALVYERKENTIQAPQDPISNLELYQIADSAWENRDINIIGNMQQEEEHYIVNPAFCKAYHICTNSLRNILEGAKTNKQILAHYREDKTDRENLYNLRVDGGVKISKRRLSTFKKELKEHKLFLLDQPNIELILERCCEYKGKKEPPIPIPECSQKEAIGLLKAFTLSKEKQVFILSGAAGTGKTTVIAALIQQLHQTNRPYVLLGSTGRATDNLVSKAQTEAQTEAQTIHKKIYKYPARIMFKKDCITLKENEDDDDTLYIVDEASMVPNAPQKDDVFKDCRVLDDLFKYCGGRQMIFVGDDAQLPPVNETFSPALAPLYIRKKFHVEVSCCELSKIVRQSEQSGVLSCSQTIRGKIKEGKKEIVPLDIPLFKDVNMYPSSGFVNLYENTTYSPNQVGNSIVITQTNKEALDYNTALRERAFHYTSTLCVNEYVQICQTSYAYGDVPLYNGSIVKVIKVDPQTEIHTVFHNHKKVELIFRKATIQTKDKELEVYMIENTFSDIETDFNMLLELDYRQRSKNKEETDLCRQALICRYGYAITCNKAEGADWGIVYLCIGDHQQLNAQWLYTGITRAKEQVNIIAG